MQQIIINKIINNYFKKVMLIGLAVNLIGISSSYSQKQNSMVQTSVEINNPLAVVNGDTIFVNQLDNEIMKIHTKLNRNDKIDFDYRTLLDKLIEDYLIQQEAYSLGMGDYLWLLEELKGFRINNARDLFIKRSFRPDLTFSHETILDYYNKNYFKMQISTVTVDTKEKALQVIDDIKNGAPMDSIATAISIDSKKFQGGLHKLLNYADTENQLRDAATKMKVGQLLSEPIKFSQAFVVMRLEQYVDADTIQLPYYENVINRILASEKQEKSWDYFIDSLSNIYPPIVFKDAIEKVKSDSMNLFTESFVKGDNALILKYNDDYKVDDNSLRKEISYAAMSDQNAPFEGMFQSNLNGLKTELLLNYVAFVNGYFDSLSVVDKYYSSLDSAVIEIYLSEIVVSKITFNKDKFNEYYNEHLEDFRDVEKFQIAKIQVSTKDSADLIYSRLENGTKFEYLMEQINPDNIAEAESKELVTLENFPKEIQDKLNKLNINQYSELYQTSNGWIILYIKNRVQGRIKTIDEVDKDLRRIMFQKKFDEEFNNNISILKKNSKIVYFDDNINEYFNK